MLDDQYYELKEFKMARKNNIQINRRNVDIQIQDDLTPEFTIISNQITLKIKQLDAITQETQQYQSQVVGLASTEREKQIKQQFEFQQNLVMTITQEIKILFQQIENLRQNQRELDEDSPELRAILFKKNSLLEEFNQAIIRNQDEVQKYKEALRKKMVRQIQFLDPKFTEDDTDDPLALEKIVVEKLLGTSSVQIQYRVEDIKEKYQDILKLERSVQLTHKLMQEIAIMVNAQGQDIDTIETHLNKAKTYVNKAEKYLAQEKKIHQTGRKKLCCIIFLGLLIIGIIMTPVILKIINSRKTS